MLNVKMFVEIIIHLSEILWLIESSKEHYLFEIFPFTQILMHKFFLIILLLIITDCIAVVNVSSFVAIQWRFMCFNCYFNSSWSVLSSGGI